MRDDDLQRSWTYNAQNYWRKHIYHDFNDIPGDLLNLSNFFCWERWRWQQGDQNLIYLASIFTHPFPIPPFFVVSAPGRAFFPSSCKFYLSSFCTSRGGVVENRFQSWLISRDDASKGVICGFAGLHFCLFRLSQYCQCFTFIFV